MILAKLINSFLGVIGDLSNTLHISYMRRVAKRLSEYLFTDGNEMPAKLTALGATFNTCVATEDNRYLTSTKSALTDALAEADQQRDSLLTGVHQLLEGFAKFVGDDEKQQAAQLLLQQYKLYKLRATDRYEVEGEKIDQFLSDCNVKLEQKQAVKKLALNDMLDKLKAANDEAMRLVNLRNQQRALTDTQALQKARKATDEAYADLVQTINAYSIVEADDLGYSRYQLFIQVLNEDIHYYKTEVLKKIDRTKKDDGGDTPTPEPTPDPDPEPTPDPDQPADPSAA